MFRLFVLFVLSVSGLTLSFVHRMSWQDHETFGSCNDVLFRHSKAKSAMDDETTHGDIVVSPLDLISR